MGTLNRRSLLLITVLVSLTLGFFAAEIFLRLLPSTPTLPKQTYVLDSHLPYKPKPFSVKSGPAPDGGPIQEYRNNSLGFRDVEHRLEKGAQVFRILGLGDSFTYGSGASFEETYLYRLETMLNQRPGAHPRVEIIKAGISRYYPEPERILLESYGVQYSPDLVLVGFLPNDVIDTYEGRDAIALDPDGHMVSGEAAKLGAAGAWLYKVSYVLRLFLSRYTNYQSSKRYHPREDEVNRDNGYHEKDWKTVEAEFGKMATIAGRLHSGLVIVHIPQRGPWTQEHFYPGKRLSGWASKNGVGFVDTLPGMVHASKTGKLYYKTDGHCTPAGYAVVAQEIYGYLTRNGLVP
jgi:hypothetical protein